MILAMKRIFKIYILTHCYEIIFVYWWFTLKKINTLNRSVEPKHKISYVLLSLHRNFVWDAENLLKPTQIAEMSKKY